MPLAQSIASHAVPVLVGVSAIICILCTALVLYVREWHVLERPGAVRALCGAVAATGLGIFAFIAWALHENGSLILFDHELAAALGRELDSGALRAFALITKLGDTGTLIAVIVAVAIMLSLQKRHWLAWAWVALVAAGGSMNPLLKGLFGRVRPEYRHDVVSYPGLSFPSGHAQFSFIVYALLTYLIVRYATRAWHLPTILAAGVFICLVGFSRVMLQVHYFSDVMAGWAFSLAWLAMSIAVMERARSRQA